MFTSSSLCKSQDFLKSSLVISLKTILSFQDLYLKLSLCTTRRSRSKKRSKKLKRGNATCAGPVLCQDDCPIACAAIPLPCAPCRYTRGLTDVQPVPVLYTVICYYHTNTYDHSPCSCLSYGRAGSAANANYTNLRRTNLRRKKMKKKRPSKATKES